MKRDNPFDSLAPWVSYPATNLKDKDAYTRYHIAYMLNRSTSAFKWDGDVFAKYIPSDIFETQLQSAGCVFVTDKTSKGIPVSLVGNRGGGTIDEYHRSNMFISANVALTTSEYKIDDGFFVKNDRLTLGLIPIFSRYAAMLSENEISLVTASILARAQFLITAGCDADKLAADEYIKRLQAGDLKAVAEKSFTDGIRVQPAANSASTMLTQLIEMEQYLKASELNEIGLDANYNMKRESLSMTESQMNDDALLPFIDNMLTCREQFADEWNASEYADKYGEISVSLESAWKNERATQTKENTPDGNTPD